MLITAGGIAASSFAQPAPQTESGRKFSIGYLKEGSDLTNATSRMERLRQFLLARLDFRAAGYDGIVLSQCGSPRDMVQRIIEKDRDRLGEFDLVFATAMVYAQSAGAAYEPILQFKQPGDIAPGLPGRETGVFRQGVIFVGPSSPLFGRPANIPRAELARLLGRTPLAVPSDDSAAGYLSPHHVMVHDLKLQNIPAPLFCGSDEEVIKHVVSGLLEVGACREEALLELLPNNPAKYYRILCKTDVIPTDPILVRRSLVPSGSLLGGQLKLALRDFFDKPDLKVITASPRAFETIVTYLQELNENRQEGPARPAPTPPPTPAVSPTPTPRPEPAMPKTLTTPSTSSTITTQPLAGRPASITITSTSTILRRRGV